MGSGYGSRLASGGVKASFPTSEKITQARWDAMWIEETPSEDSSESGRGNSNDAPTGDACAGSRETSAR